MPDVNIANPGNVPSPFPVHKPNCTCFGTAPGVATTATTMTGKINQNGSTVVTGVFNNSPPSGMTWQFDFNIPGSVSGNATLVVTCSGATDGTRNLSIT